MLPLISCLCLTHDRPEFLAQAIQCFKQQTYPNKELVVVDNGKNPIKYLVPRDPFVSYLRLETRAGPIQPYTHGELMNIGSEFCRGEIIATWDDDDWFAHNRLDDQFSRLGSAAVTGYSSLYFYEIETQDCYLYVGPRWYCSGTSQMFTKEYWKDNPFRNIKFGADGWFSREAHKKGLSTSAPGLGFIVARAHKDSTCPPHWTSVNYSKVPFDTLPVLFRQLVKVRTQA